MAVASASAVSAICSVTESDVGEQGAIGDQRLEMRVGDGTM
jgi:hypothetical protein